MSLLRRRAMMEQIPESDTGYIGIYTITEPITNDIEISSVLSEFIGSGEIWIKKEHGRVWENQRATKRNFSKHFEYIDSPILDSG